MNKLAIKIGQERLLKVLLGPHMSEKTIRIADHRQHAFKVLKNATKTDIKNAVEQLFNVKVESVQTNNVKPKTKRINRKGHVIKGCRNSWKKAYVKLEEGHEIKMLSEQ